MRSEVSRVAVVTLEPFSLRGLERGTSLVRIGNLVALSDENPTEQKIVCEEKTTQTLYIGCYTNAIPWTDADRLSPLMADQIALAMFNTNELTAWWARAFLFGSQYIGKGRFCPVPASNVKLKTRDGVRSLPDCPHWTIQTSHQQRFGIITISVAEGTAEDLTDAAETLLIQAQRRVECQVTKQLGDGEAARRIISSFSFLHG